MRPWKQQDLRDILQDPVIFAWVFFDFEATEYQARLLRDKHKRIVVRWSRQAGKTTTIALRAIWYAITHKKTLTLIVAPSLRQSMIMSDRIEDFLMGLPAEWRSLFIRKIQRTVIRFYSGSRIVALPNSPQLLRGYTANQVICDEAAFFRDDELVFYNVLYPMLATTDGTLIVSSTPWSKNSVYYKMCFAEEFEKHVVSCDEVVRSGLIKQSFIDEMKDQMPEERFQREFEAKFVEDVDAWLTQSLIVTCIDSNLDLFEFQDTPKGSFYIGCDLGKHRDYSVVVVVSKAADGTLSVVHVHRFPLETEYASVIGYIKSLSDRWKTVEDAFVDQTGVGEYIVEDMKKAGIVHVKGITFTVKTKQEMATILREKMKREEVKIPYTPSRSLHDIDLVTELNVERFELAKTGYIKYSHPEGSHDDIFWAVALAVYAAAQSLGKLTVAKGEKPW